MPRKKKNLPQPDDEFQILQSPFAGMAQEEISILLANFSEQSAEEFSTTLTDLQSKLPQVNPLLLLSSFAYYGLTTDGVTPESDQPLPLTQHHVELLQALILMNARDAYSFQPIIGDIFLLVQENLVTLSTSFHFQRLKSFNHSLVQEDRRKLSLQEYMRTHTQTVRNWGHPKQMQSISTDLFEPLNDVAYEHYGVRFVNLIEMFFKIVEVVEERINQHRNKLIKALKSKNKLQLVTRYFGAFSLEDDPATFLNNIATQRNLSLTELRAMIVAHSDLFLSDIFTLTVLDFVDAYPSAVSENELLEVLSVWSLEFGDLRNNNIDHFFMGNPVWQKPLIKLDESTFYCPIVGLLVSFCMELVESLISEKRDLKNKYEIRRAEFLEAEVTRLFASALPSAQIYVGSQWKDKDEKTTYENDLLIVYDTTAFIIEAKSGRVNAASRRGAPLKLANDIEKLIADATLQAQRMITFLQENPRYNFTTRSGETNAVDVTHVKYFQSLVITLDFLGALSSHIPTLMEADLLPNDVQIIPTLSLSDIQTIVDILDDSAQFLHYLHWRTELERETDYFADEIDLLVTYVKDNFSETKFYGQEYPLHLYGESEALNPYFLQPYHKQNVKKPSRRFTKWWRDMLNQVKERKILGWTQLTYLLLTLPFQEQKRLEREYKKCVKKLWKSRESKFDYVYISNYQVSIIILIYNDLKCEERNQVAGDVAGYAMKKSETEKSLVIALNIKRQKEDYPYSAMMMSLPNSNKA